MTQDVDYKILFVPYARELSVLLNAQATNPSYGLQARRPVPVPEKADQHSAKDEPKLTR